MRECNCWAPDSCAFVPGSNVQDRWLLTRLLADTARGAALHGFMHDSPAGEDRRCARRQRPVRPLSRQCADGMERTAWRWLTRGMRARQRPNAGAIMPRALGLAGSMGRKFLNLPLATRHRDNPATLHAPNVALPASCVGASRLAQPKRLKTSRLSPRPAVPRQSFCWARCRGGSHRQGAPFGGGDEPSMAPGVEVSSHTNSSSRPAHA